MDGGRDGGMSKLPGGWTKLLDGWTDRRINE